MKIHLRNKTATKDEYLNSPHIKKAISDGDWSECNIIATGYITDDVLKVTCKKCKENHGWRKIINKIILMIKRARKFNELIEPMFEELSDHQKDVLHYAAVGFMSNHMPIKELKNLQEELNTIIAGWNKSE